MDKDTLPIKPLSGAATRLVVSEAQDYALLLSWLKDADEFTRWAGPSLAPAATAQALQASLQTVSYQSFSLLSDASEQPQMLGFGQIQLWTSRAHLGRLIIAPEHRNNRLSYVLVNRLIEEAARQQPIVSVSLFVNNDNVAAKTSYENLGFVPTAYPKSIIALPDCTFMTLKY